MPHAVYSDAQSVLVAVLTQARRDAGLLQAEVAARVGKDQSYISNIERGQRRVDVPEFYALAVAMQADPAKLFASFLDAMATIES